MTTLDTAKYDRLDALVDEDPIALRDEAFRLLGEVERLRADQYAAEERGYRKAIAKLRNRADTERTENPDQPTMWARLASRRG